MLRAGGRGRLCMGRSCGMNVCVSRWGGEGINQFPGSEEKLAVFASLRPAGKTEAWFNFLFKENPLQVAEISQKAHNQPEPKTPKSCSRRRKNTTFSKHRQVNMNKKCPSCIINYYFRKKTDSFSLNRNIQIFPLAQKRRKTASRSLHPCIFLPLSAHLSSLHNTDFPIVLCL